MTGEDVQRDWLESIEEFTCSDADKEKLRSVNLGQVYTLKETKQNCIVSDVGLEKNESRRLSLEVLILPELNTHLPPHMSGHGVFGIHMEDLEVSTNAKFSDLKLKEPDPQN